MKPNLFSFIAVRILLLSKSTAQPHPTIQCPSLPPNQHVSRIHCENHDGSVVEVDGPGPFNCKLSYVAIRSQAIEGNTHQQQEEPLNEERGQCELWLLQFSNDGLVQQSCCGEAGERLTNRVSRAQEQQDPDWDPAQQSLEFQNGVGEPVQHFQTDDPTVSEDDEEEDDEEEDDEEEDDEVEDDEVEDDEDEDDEAEEEEEYRLDDEDEEGESKLGAEYQQRLAVD